MSEGSDKGMPFWGILLLFLIAWAVATVDRPLSKSEERDREYLERQISRDIRNEIDDERRTLDR